LTIWHCILTAESTKTYSFRLFFWRFCSLGYYGKEIVPLEIFVVVEELSSVVVLLLVVVNTPSLFFPTLLTFRCFFGKVRCSDSKSRSKKTQQKSTGVNMTPEFSIKNKKHLTLPRKTRKLIIDKNNLASIVFNNNTLNNY